MRSKAIVCALVAAAVFSCSAQASAESYSFFDHYSKQSVKFTDIDPVKDGLNMKDGYMIKTSDGKIAPFTGIAKTPKGSYCYIDGIKWTGWYKQNGKWYYFDPEKGGAKAEKSAVTKSGKYYLDENGAWNGKMTKNTKCPDDFLFSVSWSGYSYHYYLNTSEGIIEYDNYVSDSIETSKNIKISAQDMQIIYDELISCGAVEMTGGRFYGEELAKKLDRKDYAAATDMTGFDVRWEIGGVSGGLNGDYSMYDFYSESEEVQRCSRLLRFAENYMKSTPEYKEIAADEAAYLDRHKYDEAPFDELTEVKTKAADIYKFRGISSPSGGRAKLITSKAEMNELISMLKKEGIGENSKLIGRLSSYSDEYFKDNAVIFGDGNASSGSVKIGDPKIYTGYGNIYLNVTCKYEGACTDDCCYFAAVAETDKKSLGCEKAAPNVIWRCETVYVTE